jgi:hypothetical protein
MSERDLEKELENEKELKELELLLQDVLVEARDVNDFKEIIRYQQLIKEFKRVAFKRPEQSENK